MRHSMLFAAAMLATGAASYAHAGANCAGATALFTAQAYTSDTTSTTNWMTSFGPLVSPSNDMLYTFTGSDVPGSGVVVTAANYAFAMYLIPSCSDTGTEPVPIGATATVGATINFGTAGVVPGNTYFIAVTGTAAGGPGANGTATFQVLPIPVTLQTFTVE